MCHVLSCPNKDIIIIMSNFLHMPSDSDLDIVNFCKHSSKRFSYSRHVLYFLCLLKLCLNK